MAEIGTMFEKLPSTHWSLRELEVDDAYKLTYTKAWSNDPEATLTFERDFTGYKCYDADCQPLSGPSFRRISSRTRWSRT